MDYARKLFQEVIDEFNKVPNNTHLQVAGKNKLNVKAELVAEFLKDNPRITSLDLAYNQLFVKGSIVIAEALKHSNITNLDLEFNVIHEEGSLAIIGALKHFPITSLSFKFNLIGEKSAIALANVLKDTKINSLNLQFNRIGNKGAVAIAKAVKGTEFVFLSLRDNSIDDKGILAVLRHLKDMKMTLLLDKNPIGFRGGLAIAKASKFHKITCLDIWEEDIGDQGAITIANELKGGSSITVLKLRISAIGDAGAIAIANVLKETKIHSLTISQNEIKDKGAMAIANNLKNSLITLLDLSHNHIQETGAKAIANVLKDTNIGNLDLGFNYFGAVGAEAIVSVLKDTKITTLSLSGNKIGLAGSRAIGKLLNHSQLVSLHLNDNDLSREGIDIIINGTVDTTITELTLFDNNVKNEDRVWKDVRDEVTEPNEFFRAEEQRMKFKDMVSSQNDILGFVIEGEDWEPTDYIKFTKMVSDRKQAWIIHFNDGGNHITKFTYTKKQIDDFVLDIEIRLAEFFGKLQNSCIKHVKLLLTCEKMGLKVAVDRLLDYRSNYVLLGQSSFDILHPAVCILMKKYGKPFYFENKQPSKNDLINIWKTSEQDALILEDELKEFSSEYSKESLLEVLLEGEPSVKKIREG